MSGIERVMGENNEESMREWIEGERKRNERFSKMKLKWNERERDN